MSVVHKLHTTDTLKVLSFKLQYSDIDGTSTTLDLTNAVAGDLKFKMINKANGKVVIPLTAIGVTFTASTAGLGQYDFSGYTTYKAGIYYGYVVYTDATETDHYPFETGDLEIWISSDTQTAQDAYREAIELGTKTTVESEILSGFPSVLVIGDSYTNNTGQIKITITDGNGLPITSLGTLDFVDATIVFTAFRPNDSSTIVGTCEFVDDITETYILLTLPANQTILGKAEYTYEGRLKFFWEGPSSGDSDDEQKTYKTTPFKFIANP